MSAEKIVWTIEKWFEHNSTLPIEKYNMLKEIVKYCLDDIEIPEEKP